jgi:glutaredoxin 3
MAGKRRVEVLSAECGLCEEAISTVRRIVCSSCDVEVLDIRDRVVAERAKALGIRTVLAVIIDGRIAGCCVGAGPKEAMLRAMGIGAPLS